ncbi:MAG: hypothetical protein JWM04_2053, partial [Verrucomicrobiales bacterium]|nr:hypothetical protein [Verrucomicrobiales bacterium]
MRSIIKTIFLALIIGTTLPTFAQTNAPAVTSTNAVASTNAPAKDPTTEQRIADLEAYVNNGMRAADTATNN